MKSALVLGSGISGSYGGSFGTDSEVTDRRDNKTVKGKYGNFNK